MSDDPYTNEREPDEDHYAPEKEWDVTWSNVQDGVIKVWAPTAEAAEEVVRDMAHDELEQSILGEDFNIEFVEEL